LNKVICNIPLVAIFVTGLCPPANLPTLYFHPPADPIVPEDCGGLCYICNSWGMKNLWVIGRACPSPLPEYPIEALQEVNPNLFQLELRWQDINNAKLAVQGAKKALEKASFEITGRLQTNFDECSSYCSQLIVDIQALSNKVDILRSWAQANIQQLFELMDNQQKKIFPDWRATEQAISYFFDQMVKEYLEIADITHNTLKSCQSTAAKFDSLHGSLIETEKQFISEQFLFSKLIGSNNDKLSVLQHSHQNINQHVEYLLKYEFQI
jgi:hypothetical protein